jgi:hypothetical protein
VNDDEALRIILGAGLSREDFQDMQKNALELVNTIRGRRT